MNIVRTLHEAFNRRDRDALLAPLAEDVVWHVPGSGPMAGSFAGREIVWRRVFEPLWVTPARIDELELVEHGDQVVALIEWLHNFGDGEQRWKGVEVLRLSDGLVAERHEHMARQAELDALFVRGCASAIEP